MKYKIGDRVYLRDDLNKDTTYDGLDWTNGMLRGTWGTIKMVYDYDYDIVGDFTYSYNDIMIDHEKTAQLSNDTTDEKPDDIVYITEEYINGPEEKIAQVISNNLQNGKTEIFKRITDEMLQLYKDKNEDYGDSFKKVRDEYPEAIIIRLMDKLGRLKSLYKGDVNIKDEGIENVLIDMANYCVMELVEMSVTKD